MARRAEPQASSAQDATLRKTRKLTVGVLIAQAGILCVLFFPAPGQAPAYLGFVAGEQGTLLAWLLAALLSVIYVRSAATLAPVREYLFKADALKLLAVLAACGAGIVEEVVFRKLLMDFLASRQFGAPAQVLASALAFGLVHALWCFASWRAGVNAVLSTTLLGGALALIYLIGGRSLAPCVVAHFLISALIEPGLMHAAVQGRIGYWHARP